MTNHPVILIYTLPFCAAMAVKAGLRRHETLKATTINAAEIAGIADRAGSLERGKDADVIICRGDILSIDPGLDHVFISGEDVINT